MTAAAFYRTTSGRRPEARPAGSWMGAIPLAIVVVVVGLACCDELAGRLAMAALTPVVERVSSSAAGWLVQPLPLVTRLAAAAAVLLLVAGCWYHRAGWPRWLLLATAFAMLAQLALLHHLLAAGVTGYAISLGLVVMARTWRRGSGAGDLLDEPGGPITVAEAVGLCVILTVAIVLRLYALNRIPNLFEGELSPYMVGAASWRGMLLANAGVDGPWAPLGLLYYLPIRLGIALVGPTVMAVRLGSALIALVTVALAWLLAREAAGRWAGLATALLLSLDPVQVGWGRSDIHPHGATAWPGLLLCWVMIRLYRQPRWPLAAAAGLLMGLAWHQYPSGQLVVALPLVCVGGWWLADRDFRRQFRWSALWLAAGAGLWLAGEPLVTWAATGRVAGLTSYLARLGPRIASRDPDLSPGIVPLVSHTAGNAFDLLRGLFVAVPHLFHQTLIPAVAGLTVRALPWPTVVLAMIGLAVLVSAWRRPASLPLLVLVACGAAPAMLAQIAYVKRAALMYPGLIVIAGVGAAAVAAELAPLLRHWWQRGVVGTVLVVALAGWFAIETNLWFSGDRYPAGRPVEEAVAEAVAGLLEPGTIVIAVFSDHYLIGKLTFLLLDDLQAITAVDWVPFFIYDWVPARLAAAPLAAARAGARRGWTHRWAPLGRDDELLQDPAGWRRLVYLVQRAPETDRVAAAIEARCGGHWRRFEIPPHPNVLDLMVCPLPDPAGTQ